MKLPGMPGGDMMRQLQKAQERMQNLEQELTEERLEATAGGGMIKAVFNGAGELQEIKIGKEVVDPDDVEMLEDLIVGVIREGQAKAVALREEKTRDIVASLPQIPGMKMPF
jgi:nucleoid-associated protein EbfC